MHKFMLTTAKIACLLFFVAFVFGCDSQTEPPQAPKVITQKIAVSPPAQPTPPKPPAAPPAPKQPSGQTQQAPSAKPDTPVKPTQPPAVAQQPAAASGKKTASAQSTPTPEPVKAKEAAVSAEKPVKAAPSTPPPESVADKDKEKSGPDTSKEAPKTADAGEADAGEADEDKDAEASDSDLKKMVGDATEGYSPAGKVDPFLPLFEEKPAVPEEAADAEKQKKTRRMPLTPLERVDLSQLKLVGIIQASSGNKALVEEASGKGYIIKKGTFIGIHAGRVLEIQKDRVVVEEEVENVLGQYTLEKKELKLQKPPGEF